MDTPKRIIIYLTEFANAAKVAYEICIFLNIYAKRGLMGMAKCWVLKNMR
jgi:hypothetical protein